MTNLEKYQKALRECIGAKENEFNDEILRYNVYSDWDSVGHMELIAALEEYFCIQISTRDVMRFNRYSVGIEMLGDYGVDMSK